MDDMQLEELAVYRIAVEVADLAWVTYEKLGWQDKKIIGDQWIRSIDSIGANLAEGFGRFHYLDKNKFHYNARGSLFECIHWTEQMHKRLKLNPEIYQQMKGKLEILQMMLNNYISSTRDRARNSKSPRSA